MAGDQMGGIPYTGDPASRFNAHYALFEQALAAASTDQRFSVSLSHSGISLNLFLEPMFPDVKVITSNDPLGAIRACICHRRHEYASFRADQPPARTSAKFMGSSVR